MKSKINLDYIVINKNNCIQNKIYAMRIAIYF